MFASYRKTALRAYRKKTVNAIILWLGLVTGTTVFFLTGIGGFHEFSYDRFHDNGNRIFRLQQNHFSNNALTNSSASTNFALGQEMALDFAEIEDYSTIIKNKSLFIWNDEVFKEDKAAFVSENFFRIFSFPLLRGNDSLVFNRPYTIAISETLAKKIFKDEDPIGKTLSIKGRYLAEVTGIFQDMPENSHMNFHVLYPMSTWRNFANKDVLEYPWRWDGLVTYIVLHDENQFKQVEEKIPALIERKNGDWLRESNQKLEVKLQPLYDIHLKSHFNDELSINGSYNLVVSLLILGTIVLLISWINFIGLSVNQSLDRAKETGIRKVLGSHRNQILIQFLGESLMINGLVVFLSVVLVYYLMPAYSALLGWNFSQAVFFQPLFWFFVLGFLFLSTLITGLYPAIVSTRIKTSDIIKGKFTTTKRGKVLQQLTVFIPFVSSVILLCTLFVAYRQLEFLKQQNIGIDIRKKLVVRDSEIYDSLYKQRVNSFKLEILNIPGVMHSTYVSHLPGEFIDYYNDGIRVGADKKEMNEYRFLTVDEHFVETLHLQILAGTPFTPTSRPRKEILINENALTLFGFKDANDALEQKVVVSHDTVTIRAVINNYHQEAPKFKIPPTYYLYDPSGGYYFIMQVNTVDQKIVEEVKKLFNTVFPGQPFIYFFLDEKYNLQYAAEERFEKSITYLFIVLLAISCTGLFSLAIINNSYRLKEVAIRKALGSTQLEIIYLFMKNYFILTIVSIVTGVPIAYFLMNEWLKTYHLKIPMSIWMFILPSLVVVLIAFLTVISQTLNIANTNPAKILKEE